jgi:MoxR-like ATPase
VDQCHIATEIQEYLVNLCEESRSHEGVVLGVSPRGMLIWQQVAKAWAILHTRAYVTPDDIQEVARPVMGVRLGVRGQGVEEVIESIIDSVEVPQS